MSISIVNFMSRRGGVGKTTLALSTAAQLASQGKKVAYLDLDIQGTHLSQVLPLKAMTKLDEGGNYSLQLSPFVDEDGVEQPGFARAYFAYWNWVYSNKRRANDDSLTRVDDCLYSLRISKSLRDVAGKKGVTEKHLEKLQANLSIMPGSCWLRDIDAVYKQLMDQETQSFFIRFISRMVGDLNDKKYDFVVIDHAPGHNMIGAVSLRWANSFAKMNDQHPVGESPDDTRVYANFVCGFPPWEKGLQAYELQMHVEPKVRGMIIINKVPPEAELSPLKLGQRMTVDDPSANELSRALRKIPLWRSIEAGGLTPQIEMPILAVRRTESVQASMDGVKLVSTFEELSERYMCEFIVPAISSHDGQASSMHDDVCNGIVRQLLDPKTA